MIKKGQLGEDAVMPSRKRLNHRGPLSIDIESAWYFITICTEGHRPWMMRNPDGRAGAHPALSPLRGSLRSGDMRTPKPPTFETIANLLLQHAREYHEMGKWRLALFLVMPDHLHLIVHIPANGAMGSSRPTELERVIRDFKRSVSRLFGIRFQRDFWDTRLRDDAHYAEKFSYICNNPVRKGLCETARDWRHVIAFNRETGDELAHK